MGKNPCVIGANGLLLVLGGAFFARRSSQCKYMRTFQSPSTYINTHITHTSYHTLNNPSATIRIGHCTWYPFI